MTARFALLFTLMLAIAASGVIVVREPHWPVEAVQVASAYVRALQDGDDTRALALTGLAGTAAKRFAAESHHQLCAHASMTAVSTHPPQTVGNRWRRWLAGRPIEQDVITVRMENLHVPCLLSVSLRPGPDGGWRVVAFHRTAG